MTNKKALESAKAVVEYCKEQRSCQNCIFNEAIKEFAERLKERFHDTNILYAGELIKIEIDNLVKEMTGEQNDKS